MNTFVENFQYYFTPFLNFTTTFLRSNGFWKIFNLKYLTIELLKTNYKTNKYNL